MRDRSMVTTSEDVYVSIHEQRLRRSDQSELGRRSAEQGMIRQVKETEDYL